MLNLILFGPPGSGKGTQAENLVSAYHLQHISTGDLLRNEMAAQTPLGLEARKFMDKGLLVPDEVVIGMISTKLEQNPNAKGFIFDGFPRTIAQAEALDKLLTLNKTSISVLLALEVSDEALVKRLLNRGKTSGRSDDQDEPIIRRRIQEYNDKTAPVAAYYREKGKFKGIPGEGNIDETFELLQTAINGVRH
jgi:adenylate kinase